jgi:hypothetical protein
VGNDDHPIFRKAREGSHEGVQHVRTSADGKDLVSSDWSGGDEDLVGYYKGKEKYRNYNHPLLSKHKEAITREEMEGDGIDTSPQKSNVHHRQIGAVESDN